MHAIEPYFAWRNLYVASEDYRSPFYEREYSEFEFTNRVYNFLLHPQWDDFGSPNLFIKILYVDYNQGAVIIEMLGEWNDCIDCHYIAAQHSGQNFRYSPKGLNR